MSLRLRVQTFVAECPRQRKCDSSVFNAEAKQVHVNKGIGGIKHNHEQCKMSTKTPRGNLWSLLNLPLNHGNLW